MKERGIIFSGPMVRALLAGTKTQTRRVVKPQPKLGGTGYPFAQREDWAWQRTPNHAIITADPATSDSMPGFCPYGAPGDRLWVRETWRPWNGAAGDIHGASAWSEIDYQADGSRRRIDVEDAQVRCNRPGDSWWPSIHMPRWASRITLEVTEVRVQRLQEISEEDASSEGVVSGLIPANEDMPTSVGYVLGRDDGKCTLFPTPRRAFEVGWDSINGDRAPWAANPWVWAISLRRQAS